MSYSCWCTLFDHLQNWHINVIFLLFFLSSSFPLPPVLGMNKVLTTETTGSQIKNLMARYNLAPFL